MMLCLFENMKICCTINKRKKVYKKIPSHNHTQILFHNLQALHYSNLTSKLYKARELEKMKLQCLEQVNVLYLRYRWCDIHRLFFCNIYFFCKLKKVGGSSQILSFLALKTIKSLIVCVCTCKVFFCIFFFVLT